MFSDLHRAEARGRDPRSLRQRHASREQRHHHPDLTKLAGWKAMRKEAELPEGRWWWEESTKKECGLHAGNLIARS